MSDSVTQVLATALDGIAERQQVTANNIANIDTPNFRATSVDFESQLQAAIDNGEFSSGSSAPSASDLMTSTATDTPVGANGNNVDLRKEEMVAIQTQYQYQTLTRAVSDQFSLLKTAAAGE
ncbi:MAG TPA: flagellar basal body rod protein FlgB [Marmoricola sp.]|nr:flagellar basal body rod protein FlgB [Marmoricola sp.]